MACSRPAAGRDARIVRAIVSGLEAALAGRRKARKPEAWDAFRGSLASSNDRTLREQVRELDVLFGDGRALDEVRRLALDESASLDDRKAALRTLIEGRPADLRSICERLVRVRFLNSVAVRGLALFDDPEIGRSLARNYRSFHPSERPAAIEVLVSRPAFARALLDQVAAGKIRREDVTAFHARQILSLGDPALARRLAEVWGELRGTAADRRGRIAELKKQPGQPRRSPRPIAAGAGAVFDRLCASCHRLHGQGGEIGPDLTGSGRDNLDYLLENIVDPGAAVSADFRMVVVAMHDGRVLNGLVKAQTGTDVDPPDADRSPRPRPLGDRGRPALDVFADARRPARPAEAGRDPRPDRLSLAPDAGAVAVRSLAVIRADNDECHLWAMAAVQWVISSAVIVPRGFEPAIRVAPHARCRPGTARARGASRGRPSLAAAAPRPRGAGGPASSREDPVGDDVPLARVDEAED